MTAILGKKEQQLAQLKINLSFKSSYVLFTKPFNIKKSETSKRNLLKIFLNEDNKT